MSISISTPEAIVTNWLQRGRIAHLCLAILGLAARHGAGAPIPATRFHIYGPVIAGAHIVSVPVHDQEQFLAQLEGPDSRADARPKAAESSTSAVESDDGVCRISLPFLCAICVELAPRVRISSHPPTWPMRTVASTATSHPACLAGSPGGREVAVEFFSFVEELQACRGSAWWGFMAATRCWLSALARPEELLRLRDVTPIPGRQSRVWRARRECVTRELRHLSQAGGTDHWWRGSTSWWPVALPKGDHVCVAQIPEQYRKRVTRVFKALLTEARLQCRRGLGVGD